jgi:hypothetical protein
MDVTVEPNPDDLRPVYLVTTLSPRVPGRCRRHGVSRLPDRAEAIAPCEAAIAPIHHEPGVGRYALHESRERLVTIEKYESERGARRDLTRPAW